MESVIIIPLIVVVCVIALISAIALFARNYIKVPPNQAAILSGRTRRLHDGSFVGFRVVSGGSALKIPVLERVDYLDLNIFTLPVSTEAAITKEGVPLTVDAVANVKIGSDEISLRNASESLLGKDRASIVATVKQTLEAHLRTICGTLTVEQINSDRQAFAQKVATEAADELKRIGIVITGLPVHNISDKHGYIEALGKKRTAEVKRDASIGEAEATRDQQIRTAEAQRDSLKKSTDAQKEGELQKNLNLIAIADAERNLNIKRAQFQAEVFTQEAKTEQAKPKAEAEAKKEVYIAQVDAEKAKVEAEITLQEKAAERKKKELEATVIRQAEAMREKEIIDAEAYKKSIVIKAEGNRDAVIAKALADKEVEIKEGEGEASKIKLIKMAEADGDSAIIKQKGLAEAEAIKAKLLAEADGLKKKAESYAALDEAARFQFILEKLPTIIESLGEAAGKALQPVFDSVGKGMANIDKVVIVDTGSGDGHGGVGKFASTGPNILFQIIQQAKAVGLDPTRLFSKLGIDVLQNMGLSDADTGAKKTDTGVKDGTK